MRANLSRRDFLAALAASAPLLGGLRMASAAPARRPNILLIMVDDMGYSDIGCYGSEIRTPNLDGLAKKGIRFAQFYNTPRCCPSRAALLTGLYPHQAGIGHMVGNYGKPGYLGYLSDRCATIAEALRPAGYRTLMVGKWHVGESRPHWPVDRGFDHYFGLISGGSNYWRLDGRRQMAIDDKPYMPTGDKFYMTDAFGDAAADFIGKFGRDEKPFFLYLAFTAPHWPLHAWPEDIARYEGKYLIGWDKLREERHKRQTDMGLLDPKWPITPRDRAAPAWDDVPNKDEMAHKMAVYAAQVDRMDQNVGKVLAKLREIGEEENTLIMFLTDNGGCAEAINSGKPGVPAGPADSFLSYGLPWANASNTPFRLYKHWVHEGGISSPFIASWPAVIRDGGTITRQVGHSIDIMATCLDVAGAEYPKTVDGRDITPLEGRSLLPTFENVGGASLPRVLFWEHEGNRAVRQGKWKLVSRFPGGWELYDMEADRSELHNLADKEPEKVKELTALYEAWAKRANVEPWPVQRGGQQKGPDPKKLGFDLKQGDVLEKPDAPMVTNRAITVTAALSPLPLPRGEGRGGGASPSTFDPRPSTLDPRPSTLPDGVIVGHGGTRCGWALYVKDGALALATRREHEMAVVTSKQKLRAGQVAITATLASDGAVTFAADGKDLGASGKLPGPVYDMPDEPLSVGSDVKSAVGDYPADKNAFPGTIEKLHIQLEK